MSGRAGAYGGQATGGDTARRTWDKEEYARRAKEHDKEQRQEGKERYEAKLAGKKYHKRASTPPDQKDLEARASRLDVTSNLGKTTIVGGNAVGRRGRFAGAYYCEHCDLNFRDNIQYVEHLNSPQHLARAGQTMDVRRASASEVRERLRWLRRKREEAMSDKVLDLDHRLDMRRDEEEKERERKRQLRNEKRRAKRANGAADTFVKVEEDDGVISGNLAREFAMNQS
ncbi:hypothetical protein BS50DRAFT_161434 [Corynespora cassiicola Philippines]|uniref:C2H2-type domain-containing protein n=1 Tax=Corynespora cassiicola Philippines TaxID=1448308 RepID=A0A2T2N6U9_CORCC|nr:hypothetical protein BS50DRAFT_161434 [Corynespora cassiicola Philippines]